MSDVISKSSVCEILADIYPTDGEKIVAVKDIDEAYERILQLPSAQPDFDITVKIDKAYDDGYEAGYLQGRHDWGDWDE